MESILDALNVLFTDRTIWETWRDAMNKKRRYGWIVTKITEEEITGPTLLYFFHGRHLESDGTDCTGPDYVPEVAVVLTEEHARELMEKGNTETGFHKVWVEGGPCGNAGKKKQPTKKS